MSQKSYDNFVQTFPSTEFLCEMFGIKNYDELFENHFKQAARLVRRGEVLQVFTSNAALAKAEHSGELTFRKNSHNKVVQVLNKEPFRKNWDMFKVKRQEFHSVFLGSTMYHMRQQHRLPEQDGTPKAVYIVKDGAYGEAVLAHDSQGLLPTEDGLRLKLCTELIAALKKYPMYTDIWWEHRFDDESVWLQPKELNEELRVAMQKRYDEEPEKSWMVTASFYPGWQPDKSKDPPVDRKPAIRVIRI